MDIINKYLKLLTSLNILKLNNLNLQPILIKKLMPSTQKNTD